MCSVVTCDSSRRSVQLYTLPEDPEKRLRWVQFVLEVNGQRLKESSCSDISICGEHFTYDCFEYTGGFKQLKPTAVPSICVKSEPEEPLELHIQVEEPADVKLEEPEAAQVKVEEPEPDHVKLEEPEAAHVMVEEPEPDHVKLEEPEAAHVMVEEPEPDHVKLEEPEAAHVMVEKPEPDDVKLEPVHIKVEEIQQEHVKEEQLQPEHVNASQPQIVSQPKPEPVDLPNTEHVHLEIVKPEELMIVSGDMELDYFDEPSDTSSIDIPASPVPSDTSEVSTFEYDEMLQKIENIDVIKGKVALLQMKRKYVVNENQLLQLFGSMCPLCGSKVKVEKVKFDLLIAIDLQCLKCDYRKHWKSQISTSAPTAEDQVISEAASEESNVVDEMEEPSDESDDADDDDEDSDDDWIPSEEEGLIDELPQSDSDADSKDNQRVENLSQNRQLCVDCGKFYSKEPHTCEHKVKPCSCNICGKRYVTEAALASHSKVHDANYLHLCKYCHAEFKRKGDKITHEQIHLNEKKPFRCSECSEVFFSGVKRSAHMRGHIDAKKRCQVCGMKFTSYNHLNRHAVVHTGLMPFECSVCQRNFNQASHLKSHMRLHTGERPFKCPHCDNCFTHNVTLKSHVLRYHTPNAKKRPNNSVTARDTNEERGGEERPKVKRIRDRSTGRPRGRPKKNPASNVGLAGENGGRGSNSRTRKSKVQKLNRTQLIDEESEDELSEGNTSSDSSEEEGETLNSSRSKGKRKKSDIDSDFDPEFSKKKRHVDRNSGQNSGKRQRRKTNTKQDT